jgi:hypothetical protein
MSCVHPNVYDHEWERGHFGYMCRNCGEALESPYMFMLPCSWVFEIKFPGDEDDDDITTE